MTHSICIHCFQALYPDRPVPDKAVDANWSRCCWCFRQNSDGITVEADALEVPCAGSH